MDKMNTILSDFSIVTQKAVVGQQLSPSTVDSPPEKHLLIPAFGYLDLTLYYVTVSSGK